MAAKKTKKPPRILVTKLTAGSTDPIKPEKGYSDCAVLIPNASSGKAAGANFVIVLFANAAAFPKGVAYKVPNSDDCYKVSMNTFFTPKGEIEVALEGSGLPGPPVIIK